MSSGDERLRQFFGSYFHQDWDIEGADTWEDVIADYVGAATVAQVQTLRDDLAQWLTDNGQLILLNPQARPAADVCEYDPNPELTGSSWIAAIVSILNQHLNSARS